MSEYKAGDTVVLDSPYISKYPRYTGKILKVDETEKRAFVECNNCMLWLDYDDLFLIEREQNGNN